MFVFGINEPSLIMLTGNLGFAVSFDLKPDVIKLFVLIN